MRAPGAKGAVPLDISIEELEGLLERARQEPLREDGYQKLLGAIRTLRYVTQLLEKKEARLADLRELLCPATTEKTEKVLKQAGIDSGPEKPAVAGAEPSAPRRKARGHGRNGAAAYSGAQKIPVPHALLKAGDSCPDSCGGKVYPQREPGVLVQIKGQAPLAATVECNALAVRGKGRLDIVRRTVAREVNRVAAAHPLQIDVPVSRCATGVHNRLAIG